MDESDNDYSDNTNNKSSSSDMSTSPDTYEPGNGTSSRLIYKVSSDLGEY